MYHFDAVLNIFVLLAISCINATDQSKRHDDDSHITFSHTYGVCTVRKYGQYFVRNVRNIMYGGRTDSYSKLTIVSKLEDLVWLNFKSKHPRTLYCHFIDLGEIQKTNKYQSRKVDHIDKTRHRNAHMYFFSVWLFRPSSLAIMSNRFHLSVKSQYATFRKALFPRKRLLNS